MKTHIHRLWLAACLLFLQTNVTAQPGVANLHQTVTHGSNGTAKVPVSTYSHKEGSMPQQNKDFGIYARRVEIFKDYFVRALPEAVESGLIDNVGLSSFDWKKWTEEDVTKLATTFNGIDMFVGLMDMKNSAAEKDNIGNYTKEAIYAQNALTELKPDCCKSWKSFANMIVRIEDANKDQIISLMKRKNLKIPKGWGWGALMNIHNNDTIAGDQLENPAFDQQAAQVLLEKAGVTKDISDNLKKPLETAVTDAVKGIKSSVTLAA